MLYYALIGCTTCFDYAKHFNSECCLSCGNNDVSHIANCTVLIIACSNPSIFDRTLLQIYSFKAAQYVSTS
jgi:hypothetical protein